MNKINRAQIDIEFRGYLFQSGLQFTNARSPGRCQIGKLNLLAFGMGINDHTAIRLAYKQPIINQLGNSPASGEVTDANFSRQFATAGYGIK